MSAEKKIEERVGQDIPSVWLCDIRSECGWIVVKQGHYLHCKRLKIAVCTGYYCMIGGAPFLVRIELMYM